MNINPALNNFFFKFLKDFITKEKIKNKGNDPLHLSLQSKDMKV